MPKKKFNIPKVIYWFRCVAAILLLIIIIKIASLPSDINIPGVTDKFILLILVCLFTLHFSNSWRINDLGIKQIKNKNAKN